MARSFLGGTHPFDQKRLSERKEISALTTPPPHVVLPMSMHIGAPCAPIVKVGDRVRIGEKIAEPQGLGAPIHASVAGTVIKIEDRPHPSGNKVLSVVIENDGSGETVPYTKEGNLDSLTSEQMIEMIKEAGITGMGGASFPAHAKLSSAIGKVDTVVLNAAECEPYITSDHRMLVERHQEVLQGLRAVMKILNLNKAHIGIESNKADAVRLLEALLPSKGGDIELCVLRTRYPQGAEKQLIDAVLGRQVPPGGLPSDVKCVVMNVSTVYAIYEALYLGKPATERVVTLTGHGIMRPRNVVVPFGTPLRHLLEEADGMREECSLLISGGPMMGAPQFDLDAGTIKGTNCLLALTDAERKTPPPKHNPCIRCGRCVESCPMRLAPANIHLFASRRDYRGAEALNVMDCSQCGVCSYVCPAKIALTQSMNTTKSEIMRRNKLDAKKGGA